MPLCAARKRAAAAASPASVLIVSSLARLPVYVPPDCPIPRLSYASTAIPRETKRPSSHCASSRSVSPEPDTYTTPGCGPAPGGIVSVPASVAFPLGKRTSNWRTSSRTPGEVGAARNAPVARSTANGLVE
jgi:hypothetical protein